MKYSYLLANNNYNNGPGFEDKKKNIETVMAQSTGLKPLTPTPTPSNNQQNTGFGNPQQQNFGFGQQNTGFGNPQQQNTGYGNPQQQQNQIQQNQNNPFFAQPTNTQVGIFYNLLLTIISKTTLPSISIHLRNVQYLNLGKDSNKWN